MPTFLSAEWVAAMNDSLRHVDAGALGGGAANGSLVAAGGRFRIAQVVRDAPRPAPGHGPKEVRTTLVVEGGSVRMEREELRTDEPQPGPEEPRPEPDVVVSLSYGDAAAMARGELEPAEALRTGRIRVRGDLSVLMAGQAILQEAARTLGEHTHPDVTY